jgi:hypothetical protein
MSGAEDVEEGRLNAQGRGEVGSLTQAPPSGISPKMEPRPSLSPNAAGGSERIRLAFWLGWQLSEVRGRYELGRKHVIRSDEDADRPEREPGHRLPLASERSVKEQRIESRYVLKALAGGTLQLDAKLGDLLAVKRRKGMIAKRDRTTVVKRIDELARRLDDANWQVPPETPMAEVESSTGITSAHEGPSAASKDTWKKFANLLYKWDAYIQDRTAAVPMQRAAYQLGRGLADTYWALDPATTHHGWRSLGFLLGKKRCEFLKREMVRISAYVDPHTPYAVIASLSDWQRFTDDYVAGAEKEAKNGREGENDTQRRRLREDLYNQGLIWRDLIRGDRSPHDLIDEQSEPVEETRPEALNGKRDRFQLLLAVLRHFWAQLLIGAAGVAALCVAAALLAAGAGGPAAAVVAILGGVNITAAGLYARAKSEAESLFEQIRLAYRRRLAADAATVGLARKQRAHRSVRVPPPEL